MRNLLCLSLIVFFLYSCGNEQTAEVSGPNELDPAVLGSAPAWSHEAIWYQIFPGAFSERGSFQ